MSRATIGTGDVLFETASSGKSQQAKDKRQPCHIIILGDFSGRGHREPDKGAGLAARKALNVDRDNFDEIFAGMNIKLDLPLADEPMHIRELDDLHPDFIYERVPLFANFRALKRKLQNRDTFDEAAAEISAWAPAEPAASAAQQPAAQPEVARGSLLDEFLAGTTEQSFSDKENIERLIKDIVAPYVTPAAGPRQAEMLDAVDQAVSHLLRKLLHHDAFQQLEASWRSLYLLLRRLETGSSLRISILDISRREIIDDGLNADSVESTALYRLLVESRAVSGADPYSFILADYVFDTDVAHIAVLEKMATVAQASNACLCAGGSVAMAGCESLSITPDPVDWQSPPGDEFAAQWQNLRNHPAAEYIALFVPRFLLRLPYGKKTSPTEQVNFEELPSGNSHEFYLWGNSAWLGIWLLAQHYVELGWDFQPGQLQQLSGLPLHVSRIDGEEVVTPCAEIHITDTAVTALADTGLAVVRSILNKDSILIPEFRSLSRQKPKLAGPWY